MTKRSSDELDEIQKIIAEKEGRVTKAYILNQAIYKYHEYIKEYYKIDDEILSFCFTLEHSRAV
ncbi:TPA: hypothetical protein ACGO9H_001892 [Streptococcus suis]